MPTSGQKRTRSERVASLALPPGQWERAWSSLSRRDVLGRIALALLMALAMVVVIRAWDPPFAYRTGYVPPRNIVARAAFTQDDRDATNAARQIARNQAPFVYVHDPEPLIQVRASLRNAVVELTSAATLEDMDPQVWAQFQPAPDEGGSPPDKAEQEAFQRFRAEFIGREKLARFDRALVAAFAPFEQRGLLAKPPPPGKADQEEILVHSADQLETRNVVKVSEVLIGDGTALRESLLAQFESAEVADRLFAWIQPKLEPTLQLDPAETRLAEDRAAEAVEMVRMHYKAGDSLAEAGQALEHDSAEMKRLRREDQAYLVQRPLSAKLTRATAVLAMVFGMFILCGVYMRCRQRGPLASVTQLTVILLMAVTTVAVARWPSANAWQAEIMWRAEILPLMLFGMTMAIVYRQELSLLLTGVITFVLALGIGHGLQGFLVLIGVATTANLSLGRIRSRSKLIYVGLFAGAVAMLLDIGLGLINNQPLGRPLLLDAAYYGFWALAAGFLMTGLLPFIEHLFGVLTDLSLLELGDVAHPLLQELVRRAPSTYNHSVTVGSIAEAAAESIHARGLLCRVGAYFHDIGKMLKPGYFVENQGEEASRHKGLVPAMSTLVIIAHIKDGADLARQHRLPQPIIDLIEQHHGTTLVEFFYERAAEQKQADPNGGDVDQSTYRYPGPKPQTKEAAVLMLADNVESASRTLVDPTPKRIESLVREVAERRLHGGQFDESGLTLRELRTIEKSMVMSLISIYHGRIKYPDQRTA